MPTRAHFRSLLIAAITLASLSGLPVPAHAQVGGSISGTVKDPSGALVPGVSVTATNTVLGTEFNAVTDGQGRYSFQKLPAFIKSEPHAWALILCKAL